MSTLLVTGASGFVGRHVMDACSSGVIPRNFVAFPKGVDLRDRAAVIEAVESIRPDAVLHLAAQSFVPRSFEDPDETFDINLKGTLHLLQGLRVAGFSGPLVYASSGDVYGAVPENRLPVTEDLLPQPRNPYAVSKIAAEQLCLQWHRSEGLNVLIARPFNHVGPGQDARFVLPAIAQQIAKAQRARLDTATVLAGDVDVSRDFTDVRDVVSAYGHLLGAGRAGETYNIASGVERTVRQLAMDIGAVAGVNVDIHMDTAKMRKAEQRRMVASSEKIREDTGWAPVVPISQTLKEIFNEAIHDVE